jgi:hypothetical protein
MTTNQMETLVFHRIKQDVNGNPRYLLDYSNLLTDAELKEFAGFCVSYAKALQRAKSIGGCMFRGKSYRGGIVFSSYSIQSTANDIGRVTGRVFKAESN